MTLRQDSSVVRDSAFERYRAALLSANATQAAEVIKQCLTEQVPATSIYLDIICRAQTEVGDLWAHNDISVTQEHLATEIAFTQMSWLRMQLSPRSPISLKILVAAAPGEPHTFPARAVADLFYLDGWEVHFPGMQGPQDDVVKFVSENAIDAVALSVTLDPLPEAVSLIKKLSKLSVPPKVIIGGSAARQLRRSKGIDMISLDARTVVMEARDLFGLAGQASGFKQVRTELGAKIARLRHAKRLSQAEVASTAELDRAYLSALEHGKHNPTLNVLFKLASALGVPVRELFE